MKHGLQVCLATRKCTHGRRCTDGSRQRPRQSHASLLFHAMFTSPDAPDNSTRATACLGSLPDAGAPGLFQSELLGPFRLLQPGTMLGRGPERTGRSSDFLADGTPPREEHRHGLLIAAIALTELENQVLLLEAGAEDGPGGPEHIEEQAICPHVGSRPDE